MSHYEAGNLFFISCVQLLSALFCVAISPPCFFLTRDHLYVSGMKGKQTSKINKSAYFNPESQRYRKKKNDSTQLTGNVQYNSWPLCTYFEWVCLVMLRIVAPSLPIIAPTNCVGTSMRSGMSDCTLGRAPRPGEPARGGPRALKPLLPPAEGPSGAAVSSGI